VAQRSPRQPLFSLFSSSESGSNSSESPYNKGNPSQSSGKRRSRRTSAKPQPKPTPRGSQKVPRQRPVAEESRRRESMSPVVEQLRQKRSNPPKSRKARSQPPKNRSKVPSSLPSFPPQQPAEPLARREASPSRRLSRSPQPNLRVVPPQPPVPVANRIVKRVRKKRRVSPMVYATRLFILGIGIGVISGTILSVLNALGRSSAQANSVANLSVEQQEKLKANPNLSTAQLMALPLNQEIADLKTALLGLSKDNSNLKPGLFLVDLDNNNYVNLQGEELLPAASTIKVPILVAFLQAVDEGRIRLDEMLTMKQEHIATGSGGMQYQPVDSEFTALETATLMIIDSDNTATNMIIERLGGIETLNQLFTEWGLKNTQLKDILPDLPGTNKTTAKDLVQVMAQVNQGKLVSMKSRDLMLRIMSQTRNNSLLPSGLGKGSFIAHKTGNIDTVSGDVGLVDLINGKRYLVGILVERKEDDPQAEELIRKMSSTIYQYFDTSTDSPKNPEPSPEPTPEPAQ